MPRRKTPTIPSDTATFIVQVPRPEAVEEPIEYRCTLCPEPVLATESDSHALNVHGAGIIRVFHSEAAFSRELT